MPGSSRVICSPVVQAERRETAVMASNIAFTLAGRKRIRSEPSSALNQLNNKHNDGNHEQKMDQTAAKVADKAQKPEHH
jgi:hypothetical protein